MSAAKPLRALLWTTVMEDESTYIVALHLYYNCYRT